MDDSRRMHLSRLRSVHQGRLDELEVQKARLGVNCPPEILTEIEDIKNTISVLDRDIGNESTSVLPINTSSRLKVFLSSGLKDIEVAQIINQTISRITLAQIEVVVLRDSTTTNEITPFSVWFDRLRSKLNQIQKPSLIVLLTLTSINDQSIFFDCGIIASNPHCKVLPICIGIDGSRDVPFPLSMYQRYQLSDYDSFKQFIKNLLTDNGIGFDEEMAERILKDAVSRIIDISSHNKTISHSKTDDALENIRQHIDRRFFELFELQSNFLANTSPEYKDYERELRASYMVPIYFNFPELRGKQFLEIDPDSTVQNAFDNIYFMAQDKVEPFTYLEKWVLRDRKTGIHLVMREVSNMIPARFVFTPDAEWEAVKLSKPYDPASSNKHTERWYLLSAGKEDK